MAMTEPGPWMSLALAEAKRAGNVSPNPAVGCVIVAGDTVVGRGFTQPPGGAHAEVMALRDAGDRAAGATAFVTLEPCSHWGRTPPCADALIEAKVAAVRCALPDPDVLVRGRGIARLRDAGITVTIGDGAAQAVEHLAAFLTHRIEDRPLVTAKFAVSLDGRIATRTGDSRWISAPETRAWTLQQRSAIDAILVGSGTVLADDPQLTARGPDGTLSPRQPLRVVLDGRGRTPLDARILGPDAPTLIITTERSPLAWREAIAETGAETLVLPEAGGLVDLTALLSELGRRQILTLLVEGGAAVHGTFFDRGLVDRVQAILSPLVIGGVDAPGAVGGVGPGRLVDAWRLSRVVVEQCGPDVIVRGDVRPPPRFDLALVETAAESGSSLP
jgi:diaminohydroxyphosphoribosylaminopyrimidine deaminase/5-amino-6-(5-phosphoribosylamino)uracil reductase